MGYAGRTASKFEHARRLAAALAYLAISQRDAVGLVTFDTEFRAMIPPRSAPGHFSVLCQALERTQPGGETPLSGILHNLAERIRRRGLVIVLSDGFDQIDTLLLAPCSTCGTGITRCSSSTPWPPRRKSFRSTVQRGSGASSGPTTTSGSIPWPLARGVSRSIPQLLPDPEGADPGDGRRLSSGLDCRAGRADLARLPGVAVATRGEGAESVAVSGDVLNKAMLLGLLGVALPVVIHLFNRRRDQVIDWGAMQFLDLGRRAQRKIRLTELLLMLARMALLALVALALARPFWVRATAASPSRGGDRDAGVGGDAPPRDVVLVVDGSDSMDRRCGGTTPRPRRRLGPAIRRCNYARGDSVAVLVAGTRVSPLIDPPSFDKARIDAVLAAFAAAPAGPRGSSDLPAALGEAFGVLERTGNPARDVIVLTDGQRSAWRPDEAQRWTLLRDLQRRIGVPPRVWALALGAGVASDAPNGVVGPLVLTRALVTPGLPMTVTTTLTNAGPGPLSRTAELFADGRPVPGSAQAVGPIPAGGRAPLSFRTTLRALGSHVLAVRLVGGDDALPGDDVSDGLRSW